MQLPMNPDAELRLLHDTWRSGIPLTEAMQLAPLHFRDETLTVAAELAPNVNVHGTAFAGSLYAVAALAGWGLVHLTLRRAGIDDGSIVIAEGRIRYLRPVRERIVASCAMPPAELAAGLADLGADAGRARFALEAVLCAGDQVAVRFDGIYAVVRGGAQGPGVKRAMRSPAALPSQ